MFQTHSLVRQLDTKLYLKRMKNSPNVDDTFFTADYRIRPSQMILSFGKYDHSKTYCGTTLDLVN